jgi:hypothetical protein
VISLSATVERSSPTSTLPPKVRYIDDEIVGWLKCRERRLPTTTASSGNKEM